MSASTTVRVWVGIGIKDLYSEDYELINELVEDTDVNFDVIFSGDEPAGYGITIFLCDGWNDTLTSLSSLESKQAAAEKELCKLFDERGISDLLLDTYLQTQATKPTFNPASKHCTDSLEAGLLY